jgi:cathepsin A (carboxypeptidase C)
MKIPSPVVLLVVFPSLATAAVGSSSYIRGSSSGVVAGADIDFIQQGGECHDRYSSEEACDANPECSWCECDAVPSSCFDSNDVAKLPADVFRCTKGPDLLLLPQDHRVIEVATQELRNGNKQDVDPQELKCFLKQQDKDTCVQDASLHCSWCTIEQDGQEAEGCLPGFIAKTLLEKHAVTTCSPTPTRSSADVEETFPNPHGVLCGLNTDQTKCDTDDKCAWCQVVLPYLKDQLPETCASKESAQQMIDMNILSNCDGVNAKEEDDQDDNTSTNTITALSLLSSVSTALNKSYLYDAHLQFSLSDNAVDPEFCDPQSPKALAGYISLEGSIYDEGKENKNYFYMFFESRSVADENTPFFIWLTGGPGCSSSLALFGENGPCSVNERGDGTIPNAYSWNSNAHALWLDQPTGVGFSYGAVDDHDEEMVGENAYYFLQSFLQSHPEYAKNPMFITGESYAGHYVPAITHRIWKGNKEKKAGTIHLNLQGMAIGNGLTNPELQYPEYADMAFKNSHNVQVIDEDEYNNMKKASGTCTALIKKCNGINKENPGPMEIFYCQSAVAVCNAVFMIPYEMTGLNPYDIREKCQHPPLCYDFSNIEKFLNADSTKRALHISHESHKWESCNMGVHSNFMIDWMKDMSPKVADVLNDGIRVLVYAGDVDFICNYLGNRAWSKALDWKYKVEFNAAEDKDWSNNSGLSKSHDGLTFLQVYDAGHMVPMNKPEVALDMINQFFSGKDF